MQGYRTIAANAAAFVGLPDALSALYGAFPTIATVMPESKASVLLMVAMNVYLRFQTSTPVGQAAAVVHFAEPQLRFLVALIRREIKRANDTPLPTPRTPE